MKLFEELIVLGMCFGDTTLVLELDLFVAIIGSSAWDPCVFLKLFSFSCVTCKTLLSFQFLWASLDLNQLSIVGDS